MYKIIKFALLLTCTLLVRAEDSASPSEEPDNLKILYRLVNDCGHHEDVTICFKMKTVSFLDRLIKAPAIVPLTDFMSLARDPEAPLPDNNIPETEQELDATLPRSLQEKSKKLDDLLWNKFSTLFTTRKVLLNVPTDLIEGRGKEHIKKKGGHHVMMMAAMWGGMMMKMMMGMIGMMAGKALMVSKIAMILAMVMGIKKMQGGGDSHPQVVYAPAEHGGGGGGGGYHRRQLDAQNLAYGSQNNLDY